MRDWVDALRQVGPAAAACGIQNNSARLLAPDAVKASRSLQDDIGGRPHLFCETLSEFDQNAPIGRILDFSEGDDQPQPFDNIQVDLVLAKQLQQFIPGVLGIVDVHRTRSGRP